MTMASIDLAPKSVRLAPVSPRWNESACREVRRANSALAAHIAMIGSPPYMADVRMY